MSSAPAVQLRERSEPPSDKLGGETFISSRMLVCLSLYVSGYGKRDLIAQKLN